MPDDAATSGGEPAGETQAVERMALVAGLIAGVVLAGLVGWLGFRAYEAHSIEAHRKLFVQAARQVALDLSTVDYQHVDADAQRVLDLATGKFYDSFSHRKQAYIDHARHTRTQSVGTVTDAGLESQTGDQGRVLIAVTVRSSNPAQAEQEPQYWRMRVTVRKMGEVAKVSDVEFVS